MLLPLTDSNLTELLKIKLKALELSLSGISLADISGKVIYANQAYLDMWGYKNNKEVLGMPVSLFWQNEEQAWKILNILRKTGNWSGNLMGKRANGSPFDVMVSSSTFTDEDSEQVCFIGSFMRAGPEAYSADITKDYSGTTSALETRSISALTPREREIMCLTVQGLSSTDIGKRLSISYRTVETHRANLMYKLNLHNRAELIHYTLQNNIML